MNEIMNRRSIRKFKDQEVEADKIEQILRAAMQAPSAANQQPWEFIVVKDKANLARLAETSPYAKPVAQSGVTFVLAANEALVKIPTAWQLDLSTAAENMLLEAVHLDLGGVWFGVSTVEAIAKNVSELYDLPDEIKPFALISVGYPDGQENVFVDRYKPERVHYEKW